VSGFSGTVFDVVSGFSRTVLKVDFNLGARLRLLDERRELLVLPFLAEAGGDLRPDVGERHRPRRLVLVRLDDVVADRRFDDVADLAGWQCERDRVEGLLEVAALEAAEIAA